MTLCQDLELLSPLELQRVRESGNQLLAVKEMEQKEKYSHRALGTKISSHGWQVDNDVY